MKMFSDCSGPCETCANSYERTGANCMAGHSDDHYVPVSPATEAKRLAAQGHFDPPENGDDCVRCQGRNGGVPGNENMVDGEPVCDYCMDRRENTMKICVMTVGTDSGNGHSEFLGVVVGKTKEEATQRAKKKWDWLDSTNPLTLYYAGHPVVTTEWHVI